MNLETIILVNSDIFTKPSDNSIVLTSVDPNKSGVFEISGSGLEIWKHCQENLSLREIFKEMEKVYGDLEPRQKSEIEGFIQSLIDAQILTLKA